MRHDFWDILKNYFDFSIFILQMPLPVREYIRRGKTFLSSPFQKTGGGAPFER